MKSTLAIAATLIACALPWSTMNQTQTETKSQSEDLCVTPAKGPIGVPASSNGVATSAVQSVAPTARVGKPAPDFEANAYINGGFKPVKLSDYKGKWVVLCFYPGDFTFV